MDERKQCGACNNLDAYWADKARRQEEERARLKQSIETAERRASDEEDGSEPKEGSEPKDGPGR